MSTIFKKTKAGNQEVLRRRLDLSVELRGLLAMIDGRSTVDDLIRKAPSLKFDHGSFQALESRGLIEELETVAGGAASDTATAPSPDSLARISASHGALETGEAPEVSEGRTGAKKVGVPPVIATRVGDAVQEVPRYMPRGGGIEKLDLAQSSPLADLQISPGPVCPPTEGVGTAGDGEESWPSGLIALKPGESGLPIRKALTFQDRSAEARPASRDDNGHAHSAAGIRPAESAAPGNAGGMAQTTDRRRDMEAMSRPAERSSPGAFLSVEVSDVDELPVDDEPRVGNRVEESASAAALRIAASSVEPKRGQSSTRQPNAPSDSNDLRDSDSPHGHRSAAALQNSESCGDSRDIDAVFEAAREHMHELVHKTWWRGRVLLKRIKRAQNLEELRGLREDVINLLAASDPGFSRDLIKAMDRLLYPQ